MTPLKCPHCQFQPAEGDTFCGGCGQRLPLSPSSVEPQGQVAPDEPMSPRRAGKQLTPRQRESNKRRREADLAWRRTMRELGLSNSSIPTPKPGANPFAILFGCFSMGCGGIGMIIGLLIILFGLMIMFSSSH